LVENLQGSVDRLADLLGRKRVTIPHVNPSVRDEELSAATRAEFIADNRLEMEIYRYARLSMMNAAGIQA
jgi:hypothetical protein